MRVFHSQVFLRMWKFIWFSWKIGSGYDWKWMAKLLGVFWGKFGASLNFLIFWFYSIGFFCWICKLFWGEIEQSFVITDAHWIVKLKFELRIVVWESNFDFQLNLKLNLKFLGCNIKKFPIWKLFLLHYFIFHLKFILFQKETTFVCSTELWIWSVNRRRFFVAQNVREILSQRRLWRSPTTD